VERLADLLARRAGGDLPVGLTSTASGAVRLPKAPGSAQAAAIRSSRRPGLCTTPRGRLQSQPPQNRRPNQPTQPSQPSRSLEDHVRFGVLVIAQPHQHDVARVDPHLLPHLPADVAQALGAVDALGLQAPVAQHAQDLRGFRGGLVAWRGGSVCMRAAAAVADEVACMHAECCCSFCCC